MNNVEKIRSMLIDLAQQSSSNPSMFFKTGEGEYSHHDKFMGVSVPDLRKIAAEFKELSLMDLQTFIESGYNEERLLALIIVGNRYTKGLAEEKETIYEWYLQNLDYVNNWNLVDASAHIIIGAHLFQKNIQLLVKLAQSDTMWHRRIAIVSTWYFIRNNEYTPTLQISKLLLNDSHDLIHKAVGWMLREMGKRDEKSLTDYLDAYARIMPRTMLRYSLEKLSQEQKKLYLTR
jgi:3-methyladenine DNA glycosylase AlkD